MSNCNIILTSTYQSQIPLKWDLEVVDSKFDGLVCSLLLYAVEC